MISAYHAKYYAYELTRRHETDGVDRLSQSLFDANVDLNPHQIDAALFALRNPIQQGVLLADEVGLGKTIEAALVLCQYWAERRRRLLVVCPASLRKQWAQELLEKFALRATVLDAVSLRKLRAGTPLSTLEGLAGKQIVIVSYQFAARLEAEMRAIPWDLVVIDEAHKLRNAHRANNRTGQALRRAFDGRKKLLLTATPLQNSLIELYGLSTLLDEHLFGDESAFRKQFMSAGAPLSSLRDRLQTFVKRTLRKQVLEYVRYTERKALTQPFNPTDDEQSLYEAISAFLATEDSYALPRQQRHLTGLILRKLLASSSHAVVATLTTIRNRLEKLLEGQGDIDDGLLEKLIEDEEIGDDYLEESGDAPDDTTDGEPTQFDPAAVRREIAEINSFIESAGRIETDTKAQALLVALELGFDKMDELKAPRKAIIFTESRRTQEYLFRFLTANGYGDKLVSFSGTNTGEESTRIYQAWMVANKGSDRIAGSPQVDRRTALIDHFRRMDGHGADIMIATEAGAEGINLQFCALIINYDLPWNPQRIEQRIGRCHRYGQRYDVVVINFLNTRNQADQRVLELLTEKFSLFSGVFGASDEVLGRIESGIDFERRILQIYDTCRQPEDIEAAFAALQAELEEDIGNRIRETQTQLLEHFDEDVHDRLKLRLDEAEARLDKIGRWFWGATRHVLERETHCGTRFEEANYAFSLARSPLPEAPVGRYQLVRGGKQSDMLAHAYRLNHPLGEWVLDNARQAATPLAELTFDSSGHATRLSVIEQLRGKSGWLTLNTLTAMAFDTAESLLFSAITDDGLTLDQETCEKLFSVQATGKPSPTTETPPDSLAANAGRQIQARIAELLEANQRLFNEERDKLEKWADDKLLATEEGLRETKARIAQLKRDARKAATLEEQSSIQNELRGLERRQRRQRQDIFSVEDEIIERRDALIDQLEKRIQQHTETNNLFTLRFRVV
ncbi:MAG: SNF2-related protein [Sulfurimicrobium sp.]|nr:SNF2-related protein [Sulfurimicrobium sp.]MDP2197327.1 SNF2-related protein [Sulfurimicrobium sp.]